MMNYCIKSLAPSLFLVSCFSIAATVDQCVDKNDDTAAILSCQELVEAGSETEQVYVRLADALNNNGRRSDAYDAIEKGLLKYPSSQNLNDLKLLVRSNLSEDEYLKSTANNRPRESTVIRAQLKVLRLKCLKMSGQQSVDACSSYLQLGGNDSDVMKKQESLLASTSPVKKSTSGKSTFSESYKQSQENNDFEPISGEVEKVGLTNSIASGETREIEINKPVLNASDANRSTDVADNSSRRLVRSIQVGLNELGFDAGIADGFEGAKTESAIVRFYAVTKMSPIRDVSEALLNDVDAAKKLESEAVSLYSQSQNKFLKGETDEARKLLSEAVNIAPWVSAPNTLIQTLALIDKTNGDRNQLASISKNPTRLDSIHSSQLTALHDVDPLRETQNENDKMDFLVNSDTIVVESVNTNEPLNKKS